MSLILLGGGEGNKTWHPPFHLPLPRTINTLSIKTSLLRPKQVYSFGWFRAAVAKTPEQGGLKNLFVSLFCNSPRGHFRLVGISAPLGL